MCGNKRSGTSNFYHFFLLEIYSIHNWVTVLLVPVLTLYIERFYIAVNENPTNENVPSEPGPTVVSDPPPDVKPKKVAAPSPSVPIAEPPLDDPKDVPPPQATPVDYQSPESFLQSTNVQIQDPNLMSALRSVFNGKSVLYSQT